MRLGSYQLQRSLGFSKLHCYKTIYSTWVLTKVFVYKRCIEGVRGVYLTVQCPYITSVQYEATQTIQPCDRPPFLDKGTRRKLEEFKLPRSQYIQISMYNFRLHLAIVMFHFLQQCVYDRASKSWCV